MSQRHPIQNQIPMFVTTNTLHRKKLFLEPTYARQAVDMIYKTQELFPFLLFGFVIMPDHCHFLLNVPDGNSISRVMHTYKRGVSFALDQGPIWQPRFYLSIPQNSANVLQYIHLNPVRKNLCMSVQDYLWSSASGRWDVTPLEWVFDHRR